MNDARIISVCHATEINGDIIYGIVMVCSQESMIPDETADWQQNDDGTFTYWLAHDINDNKRTPMPSAAHMATLNDTDIDNLLATLNGTTDQ